MAAGVLGRPHGDHPMTSPPNPISPEGGVSETVRAHVQQFYDPAYCGFCAKHEREVFFLVQGPTTAICDECIELSAEIIAKMRTKPEANETNHDL